MKYKLVESSNVTLIINKDEDRIIGFICEDCGRPIPLEYKAGVLSGVCCECEERMFDNIDCVTLVNKGEFEF